MNERIKQLAQRAGVIALSENGIAPPLEKFAELIVKECIFEMMHESTLQDNTKIQDFSVAVANRIEKHFGVEE